MMDDEKNNLPEENSMPAAPEIPVTEEPLFREPQQPPKKKRSGIGYVMTAVITFVLTTALIFALLPLVQKHEVAFSKLDQLEYLIQNRFIGDADTTKMEDAAAAGMVASLGDRWSYYISAADYADYMDSMNNSYVGVGMTVGNRQDGKGIDIRAVNEGGPAQEQGVQSGDILIQVDDTDVAGMNVGEVRGLVLGEEGTSVVLTVLRNEAEISFTVPRKHFDTPVATGRMLENNCGLVTIENFNARCSEETIAAIEDLIGQGATSLIFDVRNNPGGYKHELVKVLDYLLPEGVLFQSEDYSGKKETDMSDASFVDLPMMVLVNSESYSAAEFFAAALKDYGAAEIVGQHTVGKGYFQITTQLQDGSAVGLSMGKYYTPNGVSLAEVGGLDPDYPVEVDQETFLDIYAGLLDPEKDPQIQKAWELLQNDR